MNTKERGTDAKIFITIFYNQQLPVPESPQAEREACRHNTAKAGNCGSPEAIRYCPLKYDN